MSGYRGDLKQQFLGRKTVDHAPLITEPGRSKALPFSLQRLIMESLDQTQPVRPRQGGDVLPLFVALQNLLWDRSELLVDPAVFLDSPHGIFWVYWIWYVKSPQLSVGTERP